MRPPAGGVKLFGLRVDAQDLDLRWNDAKCESFCDVGEICAGVLEEMKSSHPDRTFQSSEASGTVFTARLPMCAGGRTGSRPACWRVAMTPRAESRITKRSQLRSIRWL